MAKEKEQNFVDPSKISVIMPYSDLEKMVLMARRVEAMEAQYKRLQDQYAAMQGMFLECLEVVKEIRDFVRDT